MAWTLADKHALSEDKIFRARVRVALTEKAITYLVAPDTGTDTDRKKLRIRRTKALEFAKASTQSPIVLQAAQLLAAYTQESDIVNGTVTDARLAQLSTATFDAVANTEIDYQTVTLPV